MPSYLRSIWCARTADFVGSAVSAGRSGAVWRESYNVPNAVEGRHNAYEKPYKFRLSRSILTLGSGIDTYHHKSQWFSVFNEPACDKKSNGEEDGANSQPVLSSPPEGEQKADTQYYARNLARNDVEAPEDKQSANYVGYPPSRGSREMDLTRPPVRHPIMECPNSWKAMTSI